MSTWNCCRTCLSVENLNPIFPMPEHHEKYTNIILSATGIKIEQNDNYPQLLCTTCVETINNTYKFRKKCEETQKILQENTNNTKNEILQLSTTFIDISDLISDIEETFDDPVEDIKQSKRKVKKKEKKERVKEKIECEICHKILTSRLSLRNHYKIHTGFDVVCEHCGKKFITRRLLLMHCRAKHGYEKVDKCSYCDYKASNAEQVKIHERLHTGERPFSCEECGASFHRRSTYLQHVAIHLTERPVQCSECPARFQSATLMRIHRRRHYALRAPSRCAVCGAVFPRRRNALRHLHRAHDTTDNTLVTDCSNK